MTEEVCRFSILTSSLRKKLYNAKRRNGCGLFCFSVEDGKVRNVGCGAQQKRYSFRLFDFLH